MPVRYELILDNDNKVRSRETAKTEELQKGATKRILIVAGELDPKFYNKDFAETIRKKMEENPNFEVRILFTKKGGVEKEEALRTTLKENNYVVELLEKFGDRFSMYWSKDRAPHHFRIFDNNILIEKEHDEGALRDVAVVENSVTITEKYRRFFDQESMKSYKLSINDFKSLVA